MRRRRSRSGQALVLVVLLLAGALLAFLGFAVDLGRLYLIRGELNVAAESMALAAAEQLVGTSASHGLAQNAVLLVQSGENNGDNRFNFGGNQIGSTEGSLASQVGDLELYATYNDAVGGEVGATSDASTARYVRVRVQAEAPLTFFQFLPVGQSGVTSIETAAVAGVSAPLCTVCGMETLAVVPVDAADDTDFGFTRGLKYTFYSQCTGTSPQALAGGPVLLQYTLLDRMPENAADTDQGVFRLLAGGIPAPAFPASEDSNVACPTIGVSELRMATLSVAACNAANRGTIPRDTLCGLNARLNAVPHAACEPITDVADIIQSYPPDSDIDDYEDYLEYGGNRRRILTVAVVDNLPFNVAGTMNVLGFRQFLLEPNPDITELNPSDPVGRFIAMYIGFPAPVRQGQFGSCGVTQGPGKVVLH